MIDFGYSQYQNFQTGTPLIQYGINGFFNWSYADAVAPVAGTARFRTILGVGV